MSLIELLATYYFNPYKPEFTIVIFIHYKPTCSEWKRHDVGGK